MRKYPKRTDTEAEKALKETVSQLEDSIVALQEEIKLLRIRLKVAERLAGEGSRLPIPYPIYPISPIYQPYRVWCSNESGNWEESK